MRREKPIDKLRKSIENMENFILEKYVYYSKNKTKFWSSFWETCLEMCLSNVNLSEKQLRIIDREMKKEKREENE